MVTAKSRHFLHFSTTSESSTALRRVREEAAARAREVRAGGARRGCVRTPPHGGRAELPTAREPHTTHGAVLLSCGRGGERSAPTRHPGHALSIVAHARQIASRARAESTPTTKGTESQTNGRTTRPAKALAMTAVISSQPAALEAVRWAAEKKWSSETTVPNSTWHTP